MSLLLHFLSFLQQQSFTWSPFLLASGENPQRTEKTQAENFRQLTQPADGNTILGWTVDKMDFQPPLWLNRPMTWHNYQPKPIFRLPILPLALRLIPL